MMVRNYIAVALSAVLLLSVAAIAQTSEVASISGSRDGFYCGAQVGAPPSDGSGHTGQQPGGPRGAQGPPPGTSLENPETAKKIGLTSDQQKKISQVLRQNHAPLLEASQKVQAEDIKMKALMDADHLDEERVIAQAARVASARADLERAHVQLLVEMRRVITTEQWQKLKALTSSPPSDGHVSPPPPFCVPPPPY